LYVGGIGLARGYLGRPDLTAAAFVPHLLAGIRSEPGARLYRTGDLVRWLPDGGLEFLGRRDHQVKLRGMRVELGEVEGVLEAHPGVRECALLLRDDCGGRLAAYVVLEPSGEEATAERLRGFLTESLPAHMVPDLFVFLAALPWTSNGKVDRRALPRPETAAGQEERFVAPRSPLEELLAEVWSDLLRVERVGVHDDFFALGGHSLQITQMVSRLRDLFAVEVSPRAVFETPTVAGLALTVARALVEQSDQGVVSEVFVEI
ncbi:MAG TPA: phosphopantetheine-binding protein, partial [Thermoanaerobaculia bacterium]|nr:phosphopantetheine-binding protein [Thermoanaerobaculia bacterium]